MGHCRTMDDIPELCEDGFYRPRNTRCNDPITVKPPIRLAGEDTHLANLDAAVASGDTERVAACLMDLRVFYCSQPPIQPNDPRCQ